MAKDEVEIKRPKEPKRRQKYGRPPKLPQPSWNRLTKSQKLRRLRKRRNFARNVLKREGKKLTNKDKADLKFEALKKAAAGKSKWRLPQYFPVRFYPYGMKSVRSTKVATHQRRMVKRLRREKKQKARELEARKKKPEADEEAKKPETDEEAKKPGEVEGGRPRKPKRAKAPKSAKAPEQPRLLNCQQKRKMLRLKQQQEEVQRVKRRAMKLIATEDAKKAARHAVARLNSRKKKAIGLLAVQKKRCRSLEAKLAKGEAKDGDSQALAEKIEALKTAMEATKTKVKEATAELTTAKAARKGSKGKAAKKDGEAKAARKGGKGKAAKKDGKAKAARKGAKKKKEEEEGGEATAAAAVTEGGEEAAATEGGEGAATAQKMKKRTVKRLSKKYQRRQRLIQARIKRARELRHQKELRTKEAVLFAKKKYRAIGSRLQALKMLKSDPEQAKLKLKAYRKFTREERRERRRLVVEQRERRQLARGKPLRKSITPGTVLIVLAGYHKGKRVVFLKQLRSKLLLVTGPMSFNGCPLRRIHHQFVIATKTKINISQVKIPGSITDRMFNKVPVKNRISDRGKIFSPKKVKFQCSRVKRCAQKNVDKQVEKAISNTKNSYYLVGYLKTKFFLNRTACPHRMVF